MSEPKDLQALLAAREEIDRALREAHAKELAIMFTDIVGSTAFFEAKGDIAGLAFVKRHNELLFPIVASFDGRIVKTIGDAIMAVFEDPIDGVRCACAMQKRLAEDRVSAGGDPIHVRIGLHVGQAMLDEGDVFGDAVNTAARVEGQADGEEVVVSEQLYALIRERGMRAAPKGSMPLKGKAEPLPLYAVDWRGDGVDGPAAKGEEIFVLELTPDGDEGLRVTTLDGKKDQGPVRSYDKVAFPRAELEALSGRMAAYLDGDEGHRKALELEGAELLEKALSPRAREELKQTGLRYLRLHLDDALAHVPWELLFDGEQFLGLRFATGRVISSSSAGETPAPTPRGKSHAVVVSDPLGDLPAAAKEGQAIAALLEKAIREPVKHLAGPVTRADFLTAVKGCRVLHYAGHAVQDTETGGVGFRLADGLVTPAELGEVLKDSAPELVVANTCHGTLNQGWNENARGVSDLASGLLLRGVRHYVGPVGEIPDHAALAFALRFWEHILGGVAFGEAVRAGRGHLAATWPNGAGFTRYIFHGEPRDALDPALLAAPAQANRGGMGMGMGISAAAAANVPAMGMFDAIDDDPDDAPSQFASLLGAHGPMVNKIVGVAGVLLLAVIAATVESWTGHLLETQDPSASTATRPPTPPAPTAPTAPTTPQPAPAGTAPTPPKPTPAPRTAELTGPIAVSILPFKQVGSDAELAFLSEGLVETLVTDFGAQNGVKLIERAQVDLEIGELDFGQSEYVDPATRAELGRIVGAEVVVVGSFQSAGDKLRAAARFVHVETGEVLHAAKVTGPKDDPFALQDALAESVAGLAPKLEKKLR